MKIYGFNNTTAFGYNKKLNKELVKRLDADNTNDLTNITISNLNSFCNDTEETLNIYVKNDNPNQEMIYDILEQSKLSLAHMVESKYPDLKFSCRETNSYYKEGERASVKGIEQYPWQYAMANAISDFAASLNNDYVIEEEEDDDEITKDIAPKKEPEPETGSGESLPVKSDSLSKQENDDKIDIDEVPNVLEKFVPTYSSPKGFDSVGGMIQLKEDLSDKIIYPATHPKEAELDLIEYGKRQPRGILFFGPPGCGKTMMAEAVSREANLPMFKLKVSRAGSKFINQTSKNYQEAFDYVEQYGKELMTPCIMLIDEVDGITKGRDSSASGEDLKQMGTLLNLVESARDKNIIIIGTTNKYDIVDEAIRRRFDEQVYIGMPDLETRKMILQKTLSQWLKGKNLSEDSSGIQEIAEKTEKFPSSALVILSDKASDIARKDGRREITKEDYFKVISENQNLKIREENYKSSAQRKPLGFGV